MRAIPLELKKAIAIGIGALHRVHRPRQLGPRRPRRRHRRSTSRRSRPGRWSITLFGIVCHDRAPRARLPRRPADRDHPDDRSFATIVNWATDYTPASPRRTRAGRSDIFQTPDFSLVGEISFDAFSTLPFVAALAFVFVLIISDFFDTMGTLVGVGKQAGYLDERGELPEIRKPLLVDSLAASAGGFASASSATTYIESSSGVAVGGRTGWVSVVTGAALLPVHVHRAADRDGAAAGDRARADHRRLPDDERAVRVRGGGRLRGGRAAVEERPTGRMDEPLTSPRRDLVTLSGRRSQASTSRTSRSASARRSTIMMMPFTFSIADGIAFGFIAYVIIRTARASARRVDPLMWVAAVAFVLYFLIPVLQQVELDLS